MESVPSGKVARRLSDLGLFISHDDFYATTAVAPLGRSRDGLMQVGCARYIVGDEVERLLDRVRAIARGAG